MSEGSHIYLHHVLDEWFESRVNPRLMGSRSDSLTMPRWCSQASATPSRSYRASDLLGTSLSSAPRRRASSNSASTVPVAKITRYGWYVVHLSWLLPRMAKVTQRQRRGVASNGKDPSRPGAGWAHGLVSETHVHP